MEQSNFCMERSDFDYGANWLLVGATEYRCTYTYFFGSVLFQILSVSGAGCLKDIAWKVATDEITYLLQSHLQFSHECRRKSLVLWGSARISRNTLRPALTAGCLFSWYEGRPLAFSYKGSQVHDETSTKIKRLTYLKVHWTECYQEGDMIIHGLKRKHNDL